MIQKRALIVDDSKSARVVLSKLLKYDLAVHAAESAEDAIAHLQAEERPDVIFMDHLMPSMDGFQAVQAIKNDPRTAAIPILMYTSQGGDLYLGQARALGAIGVLPKQLGLTDVGTVLSQLRLLPERQPAGSGAGQQPLQLAAGSPTVTIAATRPEAPDDAAQSLAAAPMAVRSLTPEQIEHVVRSTVQPLLSEQSAELRRFVLATLDGIEARRPAPPPVTPLAPMTELAAPSPGVPCGGSRSASSRSFVPPARLPSRHTREARATSPSRTSRLCSAPAGKAHQSPPSRVRCRRPPQPRCRWALRN